MPNRHRLVHAHLLAALLLPTLLTGCGGSDPAANAQAPEPEVDPRFASAEGLIDYYNEISTVGAHADLRDVISVLYPETPLQERLHRVWENSIPLLELEQACWDEFGAGMYEGDLEGPLTPFRNAARITANDGDRVLAEQISNDGTVETIHLVKIGNRWWVSAYTLEYDPEFDIEDIDLDKMERAIGMISAVAPKVLDELRSGTWHGAGAEYGPQLVQLRLLAYLQRDHGLDPLRASYLFDWSKE